jgi:hypothetical protein
MLCVYLGGHVFHVYVKLLGFPEISTLALPFLLHEQLIPTPEQVIVGHGTTLIITGQLAE